MEASAVARVKAVKLNLGLEVRQVVEEDVVVEAPVHIYVNAENIVTLMATPFELRELGVGYVLDEGILRSLEEVKAVEVKGNDVRVEAKIDVKRRIQAAKTLLVVTTACGSTEDFIKLLDRIEKPYVKSGYAVEAQEVSRMAWELNTRSTLFRLTGGVHSAALFTEGKLKAFSEDVGRHNAVDKVVGKTALVGGDFNRSVLVTSGRQPADMVLKAARMGVPIFASISAPIHSGILAAGKTGLTLVSFTRGQRMNVYTYPERILFQAKTQPLKG